MNEWINSFSKIQVTQTFVSYRWLILFVNCYDMIHNAVEQRPGWKKYIIGETNAAISLAKVIYKNIKIKIFDWGLFV